MNRTMNRRKIDRLLIAEREERRRNSRALRDGRPFRNAAYLELLTYMSRKIQHFHRRCETAG